MSIVLVGSTSGSITLQEPAVAGTTVLDLPAVSGTIVTTGSPQSGSVLQVVSVPISTQYSTTSSSFVSTGMTASITPKFATSKILVSGSFYTRTGGGGISMAGALYRNATNLTTGTLGFMYIYSPSNALELTSSALYLDSPATTSSTTYTIYIKSADSAGTAYIGNSNFSSVITLTEIAG
jgi:hypothetical protein